MHVLATMNITVAIQMTIVDDKHDLNNMRDGRNRRSHSRLIECAILHVLHVLEVIIPARLQKIDFWESTTASVPKPMSTRPANR